MALQQKAVWRLMTSLSDIQDVGNDSTALLDKAVLSCRSRYRTIKDVVDECIRQRHISATYDEFLKKYCGIDLENIDTGAITGFDASNGNYKTAEDIVPEKSIDDWKLPDTEEVFYGGLKVIYPPLNNLTSDQEFMVGALHTWWIEQALALIAKSFGYAFNDVDATPKELTVKFENGNPGVLAYVQTISNLFTGKAVELDLVINNTLYVNMDKTNPNGLSLTYPQIGYLDRCIAHEFVHAVQAANIDFYHFLASNYLWFTEGSAELVHGIDDERIANIVAITSDEGRFQQAFTSSPVTPEDPYSAGYILLRYFARQVSNGYTQGYRLNRHLMVEHGNVKSLKEIGEKFLEFAQRSNNAVQSWELLDDRLSSFYGATLKVPMKKHADMMSEDKYFLFTSTIMKRHAGSYDINFLDVLLAQYPKIDLTENYDISGLDNVETLINSSSIDDTSHVMFSGCELDLASGKTPREIVDKVRSLIETVDSSGARPLVFMTPIEQMFDGEEISENYKQLLNTSLVTNNVKMVCIGDSITAHGINSFEDDGTSWTKFCRDALKNVAVVNKGIGGNETPDALARFQTDVIDLAPDVCFLLIGGNDLWDASPADLAQTKANWKQMVDMCIANDIIPIAGLYLPTKEQITQFIIDFWGGSSPITTEQIHQNFVDYKQYCERVARDYGLLTVSVYDDLKHYGDGSIDKNCVISDLIHPSLEGRQRMGEYIAMKVEDLLADIKNKFDRKFDMVNIYDIFCKKLGVENLTKTQFYSLLCEGKIHYGDGEIWESLDYITDYIFSNNMLTPFNCPCFYVSLEHVDVETDTYKKWLHTSCYDPGRIYPYNVHFQSGTYSNDTNVYYQSEVYKRRYGNREENLFDNTGEFLAVGLHTLYDEYLWMCEQGGITCEEEGTHQWVDMNWLTKPVGWNIINNVYYPVFPDPKNIPVFPGTGCPWFVLSDDNKVDFDIETYGIDYWFTKSDYDAIITIKLNGLNEEDVYQTISMGLMTNVNDEAYLFPLYVAGGTQGIAEHIYTYWVPNQPYPSHREGNLYDLDIKRISMSNSYLLLPTMFNKAHISNFRVLAPSGEWKNIYACEQKTSVKSHPTCGMYTSKFYIVLEPPEWLDVNYYHAVYPTLSQQKQSLHVYTSRKDIKNRHTSMVDKIIVNLNGTLDFNESGSIGILPNCCGGWYDTLPVGEVEIAGKKYLNIPNGWEHRLWWYPYKIGFYPQGEEDWDAEAMRKYWDEYFSPNTEKIMKYRLLIPLEEGD